MGRGKKGGGVPEGWLGCPAMSSGFIDDRFLVFKTPLKAELNGMVPKAERFSIDSVLEGASQMNNSRIGLWIDLTNTTRYYNSQEIQQRGIIYEKFACQGHGTAPSRQAIFDFCGIVHRFFRNNHRDYIGVHCTHGFNRTGFLICCYLIRFRKYTAEEAVMEFAKYRSPGIYRQIYVNELYTMTQPIKPPLKVTEPYWLEKDFCSTDTSSRSNGVVSVSFVNQSPPSTSSHGAAVVSTENSHEADQQQQGQGPNYSASSSSSGNNSSRQAKLSRWN